MKDKPEIFRLCDLIRETSFSLHQYLRYGHLEKVYENGLTHRLKKAGLEVEQQYPLQVVDEDGAILGDFIADLYVENCLIVELKACKAIIGDHTAQLLGYLRASRIEHGLLINLVHQNLKSKSIFYQTVINFVFFVLFCGRCLFLANKDVNHFGSYNS